LNGEETNVQPPDPADSLRELHFLVGYLPQDINREVSAFQLEVIKQIDKYFEAGGHSLMCYPPSGLRLCNP